MKQFFLALTFTFITGLTFGQQPAQNHSSSASFLEKLQTDYLVESVSGKKGGGTDCDGTVQPQNQYTGLITQDLTITGQTILISGVLTVPAGVNLDISLCTVYMDPNSGIQVLDGGFLSVVGNTFSPCNGVNGGGISINGSAHSSLRHLIQDNSFSGAFAFVIAEETEGLDIINNTFLGGTIGVAFNLCQDYAVNGNFFVGTSKGILVQSSNRPSPMMFNDNNFDQVGDGITVSNSVGLELGGNNFSGCMIGMSFSNCEGINTEENVHYGITDQGLYANNVENLTILESSFYGNQKAIVLEVCTLTTIQNNTIATLARGVVISNSEQADIGYNSFADCHNGVETTAVKFFDFHDNELELITNYGVYFVDGMNIKGAAMPKVRDNVFQECYVSFWSPLAASFKITNNQFYLGSTSIYTNLSDVAIITGNYKEGGYGVMIYCDRAWLLPNSKISDNVLNGQNTASFGLLLWEGDFIDTEFECNDFYDYVRSGIEIRYADFYQMGDAQTGSTNSMTPSVINQNQYRVINNFPITYSPFDYYKGPSVPTYPPGDYRGVTVYTAQNDPPVCLSNKSAHFSEEIKQARETSLQVFPNPSNGQFKVTLGELNDSKGTLEVYTSMGQLVHTQSLNSLHSTLDLTEQASGIYILKVMANGQQLTERLVIE